jgi:hypothetical protein
MQHLGATTGALPKYDTDGRLANEYDILTPQQRLDLLDNLIDKVMAPAPRDVNVAVAHDPAEELTAEAIRSLPNEELRRLASATPADPEAAPFTKDLADVLPVTACAVSTTHPAPAPAPAPAPQPEPGPA